MSIGGDQQLWAEVLTLAINDALEGVRDGSVSRATRITQTHAARAYITKPNRDFDQVCTNAGFDPDAVRDHVIPRIEAAPTPEQIAGDKEIRTPQRRTTLTHQGETLTFAEWEQRTGIPRGTLHGRLHRGLSVEETLTAPHKPMHRKAAA